MKLEKRVISLSIFLGVLLWVFDATIDYFIFSEKTFLELLITGISNHEIYMRSIVLLSFVIFGVIISRYIEKVRKAESLLKNIFDNVIPLCITSNDHKILLANENYYKTFGKLNDMKGGVKCYESRPGPLCHTENCPIKHISDKPEAYSFESDKIEKNGSRRTFIITATPYQNLKGETIGIIESFQDITRRKELEKEKEQLIIELQKALQKVKQLSVFLPICASCKKIRDDRGYWKQIETYIKEHSEAEFSHSICPDCAKKLYPELYREEDEDDNDKRLP
jgi:PAS domain S-box-containing protein